MAGGTLTASQADGLPLVHVVRLGTPKRRHSPPRLEWPVVAVWFCLSIVDGFVKFLMSGPRTALG